MAEMKVLQGIKSNSDKINVLNNKVAFTLTAVTGYTINTQSCYIQNGRAYFRATIAKTDGTAFTVGNHLSIATFPSSYALQSVKYAGMAGGFFKGMGLAVVSGTSLVVSIATDNTTVVYVSGVLL